MPRTSALAVSGIIETDDTIPLTPFIEIANTLVTRLCAPFLDATGALAYNATDLELIERWLSAHFYAIRDMRSASEGAGPVTQAFQYRVGLFLQNSMYGQQAMMVDTEGVLARYSKMMENGGRRRVGVTFLGSTEEEQEAAEAARQQVEEDD